ncbi:uncharacterized protein LOC106153303 [Lingula anatina]|uniref:Serine protease n=1 Tax=Lingula anatina TaxID=7574 RepID=A0A1S3H967_LINAN|nr:uncharacterized protein LOC106153303 [Lingula anatina]|eukprot:XP_013382635.1 uncharacterized protein LOC106153303 [Lingula anatina]
MTEEASESDIRVDVKETENTPWVHRDDDPNTIRPAPPADVTDDVTVDFGGSKTVKVNNLKPIDSTKKTRTTSSTSSTSTPTSPVPENVIGVDDRLRVSPTKSPPYRWVCYLHIQTANGKYFRGTGFFSNILGPGYRFVILTCGHNLYSRKHGGYMKSVTVIPARDGESAPFGQFTVSKDSFRVSQAYVEKELPDDDYGAIFVKDSSIRATIPSDVGYGFGSEFLSDSEFRRRVVHVCGFPGDKPDSTMWIGGGMVEGVSSRMFGYTTDTTAGNSGSPVWTWNVYNWKVVGIHAYGGNRENSACRITRAMANEIKLWWWSPADDTAATTGDTGSPASSPDTPSSRNPGGNPSGNPSPPKKPSAGCCSCLNPKTTD